MTVGGIIPDDDIEPLKAAGVAEVFGPGTTIREVADYIRANARPLRLTRPRWRRPRASARSRSPTPPGPATDGRSPGC